LAWLQCGGSSRQDTGSEPEEAYSLGGACAERAFRIGQKLNVLVHEFVCRGTVEEKIDALIESYKE